MMQAVDAECSSVQQNAPIVCLIQYIVWLSLSEPHINEFYGSGCYIYVCVCTACVQSSPTSCHVFPLCAAWGIHEASCDRLLSPVHTGRMHTHHRGLIWQIRRDITYNCIPMCREYLQLLCLLLSC